MILCVDCKFYQAGEHIDLDICNHPSALSASEYNGVREEISPTGKSCRYMRSVDVGLIHRRCENGKLFEVKT